MSQFIIRRVLWIFLVMFASITFTFILTYIIPADPASQVAGPTAGQTEINNIRVSLALDQPVHVQYLTYLSNLLRGDLGRSWMFRRPVVDAMLNALPASFMLALAGGIIELLLGALIGVVSAVYRYRWIDRVSMIFALIALSLPHFWFGLLLLYVFGFLLPIFPLGGFGGVQHLVLPALAVGIPFSAWYARMLRSGIREILTEDYVRTARSKGLRDFRVLLKHVMPNALIPVITMWGMDLGRFIAGLALVEVIFGWPGLGWQAVQAAKNLDVPMVMGTVLVVSAIMSVMNLIVDVVYGMLDPRVRFS
ncbi:MAG: ABC transporter permease [Chloroflexi bacterium]|nr:ABC transporter permease [Chloroflexota bacterium]